MNLFWKLISYLALIVPLILFMIALAHLSIWDEKIEAMTSLALAVSIVIIRMDLDVRGILDDEDVSVKITNTGDEK